MLAGLVTAPAPAAAWSNGKGDGYGTHDWIIDEGLRVLSDRDVSWFHRTTALLVSDDPDNVEVVANPARKIDHIYRDGGVRGGAVQRITEHYAAAVQLHREGVEAQEAGDAAAADACLRRGKPRDRPAGALPRRPAHAPPHERPGGGPQRGAPPVRAPRPGADAVAGRRARMAQPEPDAGSHHERAPDGAVRGLVLARVVRRRARLDDREPDRAHPGGSRRDQGAPAARGGRHGRRDLVRDQPRRASHPRSGRSRRASRGVA